jgi:hypothetical protein
MPGIVVPKSIGRKGKASRQAARARPLEGRPVRRERQDTGGAAPVPTPASSLALWQRVSGGVWESMPPPAHRLHLNSVPAGKIVTAGPRMNFRVAIETGKRPRLPLWTQLLSRLVDCVALRAGKMNGSLDAVCHLNDPETCCLLRLPQSN